MYELYKASLIPFCVKSLDAHADKYTKIKKWINKAWWLGEKGKEKKKKKTKLFQIIVLKSSIVHGSSNAQCTSRVKAKLLELRVFFVFFVRVYLQLVVIVYSFLLLYCLLSFWCHHRCVMLRNLSSFLV